LGSRKDTLWFSSVKFSTELFIAFPHQPSALQNKTMTAKISAKKVKVFIWKSRRMNILKTAKA